MAVSKRLRYEILRRDSNTCRYCGASAPDVQLRVDHVTPVALGGTDTPDNLVTSCEPCNSGKSSATVDSALVADVSDDALRWAAAMEQAAANLQMLEKPKDEYRDAFLAEWNRWHFGKEKKPVELPGDWKLSIERFRVAGIPVWMWADIVDIGMANQKVKAENTFKYCCGVAWNKVDELHSEAGRIVGAKPTPANLDVRASVLEAAYAIWHAGMVDNTEAPTAEQKAAFRSSLAKLPGLDLEAPERIIGAALHATYFAMCDIAEALRDMDRDTVWTAWHAAWPTVYVPSEDPAEPWGKVIGGPTDDQIEWVKKQIDSLLNADVYIRRLVRAASHAGTHKSARLYLGLSDDELAKTSVSPWKSRASEIWRVAFTASDMSEPSAKEREAFFASLQRIVKDGDFILADVYEAAAAAGSYKDPDLSTCLPRYLSATKAAAAPLGGEN
ncbi:HNH endonuclease [Streptomyces canus]|uniref:HNH endonuclease n=1 Tax=Streptomyces canus TaxID=58343 RepID=UPI0032566B74